MQDVKRIEKEKRYWDKLGHGYDRFIKKHWKIYSSSLLDKIYNDTEARNNVLEVACGTGLVALKIADRASKVSGIDISEGLIDEAKKKMRGNGPDNVEFFVEDAYSLPFGNDVFDTVICTNAFQNMKYPQKALSEIKRVLKPGGRFIGAVIGFGESTKYKILFLIFKLLLRFPLFHKFSLDKLADMISVSGFSIVKKEILKNPKDMMPMLYVLAESKE